MTAETFLFSIKQESFLETFNSILSYYPKATQAGKEIKADHGMTMQKKRA